MKAVALLLILGVALVAGDTVKDKGKGDEAAKSKNVDEGVKKRMLAVGPKDLDIAKLEGKWFDVASSDVIHKMFVKGCTCNEIDFKRLSDTKLRVLAACQNKEGGKVAHRSEVEGTLTMVKPKENKSLFHLTFIEKHGEPIKGVKVNKTEAHEVHKIESGAKGKEAKAANATAGAANLGVNTVVLKLDKESCLMGSPKLDAAWILARNRHIDDKLFDSYKTYLEKNGFSSTNLKRIDQSKCKAEVLKGKETAGKGKEGEKSKETAKGKESAKESTGEQQKAKSEGVDAAEGQMRVMCADGTFAYSYAGCPATAVQQPILTNQPILTRPYEGAEPSEGVYVVCGSGRRATSFGECSA